MAFEDSNGAVRTFNTYLTKYGEMQILNNTFNIAYFSLSDIDINYAEITNLLEDGYVPSVTGHPTKTFYTGIRQEALVEPSEDTINVTKREIVFVSDCDESGSGDEWKNLKVTINVGNYLKLLTENTDSDLNYTLDPYVDIFDKVEIFETSEDAFGNEEISNVYRNVNIYYDFASRKDYTNFSRLNRAIITKNDSGTNQIMYSDNTNRFNSPFQLMFATNKLENNQLVFGAGKLRFLAYGIDTYGYLVDGVFRSLDEIEGTNTDGFDSIIPVVRFNGINYPMVNPTRSYVSTYEGANDLVKRWEGLVDGWVTAAKNFFEYYGTEYETNMRKIDINFIAGTDAFTDNVPAKKANITIEFIMDMDENNWVSSNITNYS